MHAPCVVLLPHPLLSGAALATELTKQPEHLFVQSAGASKCNFPAPLADAFFEFLLCQATLPTDCDHMDMKPVAQRRALESATVRVEQLAARLAITDRGMRVTTAQTYLALCTRNTAELQRAAAEARMAVTLGHMDSAQPGAEYSREWYDYDHGVETGVQTTITMRVAPEMASQEGVLTARCQWSSNIIEQQVEVFVGDVMLDEAVLETVDVPGRCAGKLVLPYQPFWLPQIFLR